MTTPGGSGELAFARALRKAAPSLSRPLPWIGHADPWAVFVSEVMLQQTSTSRVLEPWAKFVERFPTPVACADSTLADVLRHWSGLGYPRRARALHRAARMIKDEYSGAVPSRVDDLMRLPGVGAYTAAAVASFAFGKSVAVLDTNVGRVLARAVANATLAPAQARALAARVLPRRNAATFNQAMIDLGATHCRAAPRCVGCPVNRVCRWQQEGGADPAPRSAAVSRAAPRFEGSDRQVRGRVLRALSEAPKENAVVRVRLEDVHPKRLDAVVQGLVDDGLIVRSARGLSLANE